MRNALALIVLIWLGTVVGASADEFVADRTSDVSFKAPGGRYQSRTNEINPTGPSALRARITISKFEDDPVWAPSFQFALLNGEDRFLAFQIVRTTDKTFMAYIRRFNKGDDTEVDVFDFEPREGEAFTLQIAWTETGKLTASVGRDDKMEKREAEFGHRPEKLRIIASGGSMDITPLEFGHMEVVTSSLPAPGPYPLSSARPTPPPQSTDGVCGSPLGGKSLCLPRRRSAPN